MRQLTIPRFPAVKQSLHTELRKRVQTYFDSKGIASTGTPQLFTKALFLLITFVAVYVHVVFFTPPWYIAILDCFLLGGFVAAIGFNVMHDGSHGSFSKNSTINNLAGLSMNLLGANNFMWHMKHVVIHHTFTNVDGIDDDIDAGILLRMAPTQKRYKMHKFQHIYFWFLYSLLYVFWVFFTDYKKYFSRKIGNVGINKMTVMQHVIFWLTKVFHAAVYIVVPILTVGWLPWLIGFLIMGMFAGFILSIVFQLAHTVDTAAFPQVVSKESNQLPEEFAIHQLKTTANFATKNKLISWLVGGLNFQIEHHLFPKISHIHYPAISEIVKATCREYQLEYIEYPTMTKAIGAHVRFLRQMGKR
jgi:linoleoyl-CoA desaturase